MNAWNPVVKVGEQIREAIREHYPEKLSEYKKWKEVSLAPYKKKDRKSVV